MHSTTIIMLPDKKTNAIIGISIGIITQIAGRVLAFPSEAGAILGLVVMLAGAVLFVWGCMNFAEGKGHSKWLGLFGLLSCIGLIILIILPDYHKESK